ncbi:hypothetical protein HMI55_002495 [Coelomomyces lativittatus]|nr:hypothetical protein HMI55_002495 [Coelomomyces lativittatus]
MFDFELQHVSRENIMLADIMTCLHEVCDISPDTNTASVIEDTLEKGTYQVGQLYIHVPNPSITIKQMKDKLTKLLGEDVRLDEYSSTDKNIINFLNSTKLPNDIKSHEISGFKKQAINYKWIDNKL